MNTHSLFWYLPQLTFVFHISLLRVAFNAFGTFISAFLISFALIYIIFKHGIELNTYTRILYKHLRGNYGWFRCVCEFGYGKRIP